MKKIFFITIIAFISFIFITNRVEAREMNKTRDFIDLFQVLREDDNGDETVVPPGNATTNTDGGVGCEEVGALNTWIKNAFKFVQYAGVGLAVVLTAVDFIQVIGGSKDDDLKKAFDRTVKRLIAVVLLLLTTVLVTFIIDIIVNPVVDTDIPNCVEGM